MNKFDRIVHNAEIMGGKACIKGTRITVGMIVAQVSEGKTKNDLYQSQVNSSQDFRGFLGQACVRILRGVPIGT